MVVDILDVGTGNVTSIKNSIERLFIQTRIVSKANQIKSELLILPGVGSAGPYMDKLRQNCFDKAIYEHVNNGNRLLGICLGFQILGKYSEEDGTVEGLNLMNGYTKRLHNNLTHNGWQNFQLHTNNFKEHSFNPKMKLSRKSIINGRVFYNHEYGFTNEDWQTFNQPISENLSDFSALTIKENIIGIQFHPEKSQQTGLNLMSIIL